MGEIGSLSGSAILNDFIVLAGKGGSFFEVFLKTKRSKKIIRREAKVLHMWYMVLGNVLQKCCMFPAQKFFLYKDFLRTRFQTPTFFRQVFEMFLS